MVVYKTGIESVKRNKTFLVALGSIFTIFGCFGSLFLVIKGGVYSYFLPATGLMVIIGVLVIAWCFGEENGHY